MLTYKQRIALKHEYWQLLNKPDVLAQLKPILEEWVANNEDLPLYQTDATINAMLEHVDGAIEYLDTVKLRFEIQIFIDRE